MKLRIHVCPVGFEVDRITIPVIEQKADRVWLIIKQSTSSDPDRAERFKKDIIKQLEENGIEIREKCCVISDLNDSLKALREIINDEKNNTVSINVSSGNKVFAIAGMMACMMWDAEPYYVIPNEYVHPDEQMTSGVKNIICLPKYKIDKPEDVVLECLRKIKRKGQNGAKKKDIISHLEKNCLMKIDTENENDEPTIQAQYRHLEEHVLKPARDWGFIIQEGTTRNVRIKLTDAGLNALKIFGE